LRTRGPSHPRASGKDLAEFGVDGLVTELRLSAFAARKIIAARDAFLADKSLNAQKGRRARRQSMATARACKFSDRKPHRGLHLWVCASEKDALRRLQALCKRCASTVQAVCKRGTFVGKLCYLA